MHVLLATDGSACSMAAIQRVRTFFPKALIDVLSVVQPLYGDMAAVPMDSQWAESIAEDALTSAKQQLGTGDDTSYTVAYGTPEMEIIAAADERHVDAIVLGSHGRGVLGRLVMGSVATYVVNHASCPVLVIPQRSQKNEAPAAAAASAGTHTAG